MFQISLGCHVSPLVNHLENFIVENLDRFSTPGNNEMTGRQDIRDKDYGGVEIRIT